jgi:hypothetical protein
MSGRSPAAHFVSNALSKLLAGNVTVLILIPVLAWKALISFVFAGVSGGAHSVSVCLGSGEVCEAELCEAEL